jgi:DNA-binding transcriptional MerR regulator
MVMGMAVTISKLAGRAGVTADTLRYYERFGLIPSPSRTASGYRLYDDEVLGRLLFIKNAQHMGLRLADVKELLEIMDRGACPCGHTAGVVERRLAEVDAELSRLRTMRRELVALGERNRACTEVNPAAWWCCPPELREGGDQ